MARRPKLILALLLILGLSAGGFLYAQMESGDRGIMPLDSSGTLEVDDIHVDVAGKDSNAARFAGWRIAQREGFKKLWAKSHGLPVSQAPNLPDSLLDQLVSSIIVQREQIGPTRYIADLGVLFDRARAGELLGIGGVQQRSQPMLLIPIVVTGGSATSVELRNGWQRAWAQFRTSQTPIDYVRISGMGGDPLLLNASQTMRPGRSAWRNLLDLYGAADILVAEVQLHRLYPGGPAQARFIARHGPDREIVGGFSMTAPNSAALPQMMAQGVERMDRLFADAFAAGLLQRDRTLNQPEPPPAEDLEEKKEPEKKPEQATSTFQVQVVTPNAPTYNSALAHLRTVPGVSSVGQINIGIGNISNFNVAYRGNLQTMRAILVARGWGVDITGETLRMYVVRPAAPAPSAQPGSTAPNSPQPQPQPQPPATNQSGAAQ
ncbi:heavy-metal-associated domain-containing protein [Sphingomonas sinipercae]|uniref:Heavy-metal-associated domain-containing protein n=1 Tax=Sphingomonas sinipercae TaxID=2714944 RepID=A0A6G7ZMQ6_9SPHN|nr:heavy-metal-associated domain-containing protein [Sphingomonas sinipercae]QIL02261.1 heavy-metal-associated domain-containing protein [Sphingomonas sinipercae]